MIRAARTAAALMLACLWLVLAVEAPASADCTCKQGGLSQQAKRADVVFIGSIDAVGKDGNDHTYEVTASRAYKGEPERSTVVESAGGRNACGLGDLGVGSTYVFLATGTTSPHQADSCGGTSPPTPPRSPRSRSSSARARPSSRPRRRRRRSRGSRTPNPPASRARRPRAPRR
jgi:hypothetical protein